MIHFLQRFLPSKKTADSDPLISDSGSDLETGQEAALPSDAKALDDAERIATAVADGLEGGDYAAIGPELTALAPEKTETFVFEPDGFIGVLCAIAICALVSLGFVWTLFVGIATIVLSQSHLADGLSLALMSCLGLLANMYLLVRAYRAFRQRKRFDCYVERLKYRSFIYVDDLVRLSKETENTVVNDLKWATEEKFVPQGHLSDGNLVFMTTNAAHETYEGNSLAFDRYFQKTLEERTRLEGMTEEVQKVLDDGKRYVTKFKNYGSMAKDKGIVKKIAKVSGITESIFHEVELNPDFLNSMNAFLNIYLPTIEKLLDAYMSLEEKRVFGENVTKTKREIEGALDAAIVAFGALLEKLYQEQEDSVAGDVAAMESSMRQESLPIQ